MQKNVYINGILATDFDITELSARLATGREIVFAEVKNGAIYYRTERR